MLEHMPSDTNFLWTPPTANKPRLEAIQQRDGIMFFNYDAPAGLRRDRASVPTPAQKAVLACVLTGMTRPEVADHLDLAPNTVHATLSEAYMRLGIVCTNNEQRQYAPMKALVRLCERELLKLVRPATVHHTVSFPSLTVMYRFVENRADTTPHYIPSYTDQKAFSQESEQAGFETNVAYALHLVASRQVDIMPLAPERMADFPALVAKSPAS